MNPIHTEERGGFTLSYCAFPEEDISPEDSFDIQDGDDTLERIEDGTYAWFRVEITASRAGIDLATAHLGGCCYTSEAAFVTESGYYADLCNEAIAEAKTKLAELCPKCDVQSPAGELCPKCDVQSPAGALRCIHCAEVTQ